jgi:L-gulonolactone oxidase
VLTDGALLSLREMSDVLDVDTSTGLVRVQAGATLNTVSETLWEHGLAFENLGDIDVQSIAGATATGTHGTGAGLRNLSAGLHAIQLVDGAGNVVELDEASDPEGWRAARVSVGALGIVTEVTLQAVPAFNLHAREAAEPLEDVLDSLDDLADSNEHFEFFVFPHAGNALTKRNARSEDAPNAPGPVAAYVNDILLANRTFELICKLGRRFPKRIPALNRFLTSVAGSRDYVDRSYKVFASPRLVRFTEMEYAIPREHAAEVIRAVKAVAERSDFAVPFPIEVRFVAPDDALLSPAGGRRTCYVAVHMYERMPWEGYFRAVEEIMNAHEGRPHWGKRHFQTAETLRERYPQWDAFQAVRRRLDPDGRFTNGYAARVLGPVTG